MDSSTAKKRILILGGGFAGASTALHLEKQLRNAPDVEIALVAKENFILFTPMLHEVAGGDVAVTDIGQPLRKMLRHTRLAIADFEAIDLAKKLVRIRHNGMPHAFDVSYDQLVLALGAVTKFLSDARSRRARAVDENAGRRDLGTQPSHRRAGTS